MKIGKKSESWLKVAYERYPTACEKIGDFIDEIDLSMKKNLDDAVKPFIISSGGIFSLIALAICAWALNQDIYWYNDELQKVRQPNECVLYGTGILFMIEIIRTTPLNIFGREVGILGRIDSLWDDVIYKNLSDDDALKAVEEFILFEKVSRIKKNVFDIKISRFADIAFVLMQIFCMGFIILGGMRLWSEKHLYEIRKEGEKQRVELRKDCQSNQDIGLNGHSIITKNKQ